MSKPTELWFGSNEEHGDLEPMDAYEREADWKDDDDLGPWVLERYGVRPTVDHLPTAEQIMEWVADIDEDAGDCPLTDEWVMDRIMDWSSEHGLVDEWWCDQLGDVSLDVAEVFVADPTLAVAEALRRQIASEITYVMAGDHLGSHQLSRTLDGKVLLDGEVIGTWDPPKPPCCRACVGTPVDGRGQRQPHPTCASCGSVDCPKATAHVNACRVGQ